MYSIALQEGWLSNLFFMISELWTFGLQNLFVRTREPFFSNLRTFGLKNLRTHEPSNLRTFRLIGCNLYRLLKDRNVSKKANQIIHQTILRHIRIFESEWWTLTKRLEQQITTADMKVIRMTSRGHQMGQKEK